MSRLPSNLEEFDKYVADYVGKTYPQFPHHIAGSKSSIVAELRVDLENLFRMVTREPGRGYEIMQTYLAHTFESLLSSHLDDCFDTARANIFPRVFPLSRLEHLDKARVVRVDYSNKCFVGFVRDHPKGTISLTTDRLKQWNLSIESLEQLALENLSRKTDNVNIEFVESEEGGKAAIIAPKDGLAAARLLLPRLHERLAPCLGERFYAAIPYRDLLLTLTQNPQKFVDKMRDRVKHDYATVPCPITPDFFLVTRDGVAGHIDVDTL